MLDSWPQALARLQQSATPHVLVTVLGTTGSTPRNAGAKMVVTQEQSFDSIGGGNLEFQAINRARSLLDENGPAQTLEHVQLGVDLGQCCGGSTSLLFERLQPARAQIVLFGAGHVGQALAPILATLPVQLHWIDERVELLQQSPILHVKLIHESPIHWIAQLPAGVFYLIMTHSHDLDLNIVETVLQRGDAAFLGLIGSVTKSRRFHLKLRQNGFSKEQVKQLHSPLGLTAVPGKSPAEVAVSIAAEVISRYHQLHSSDTNNAGLDWADLQSLPLTSSRK